MFRRKNKNPAQGKDNGSGDSDHSHHSNISSGVARASIFGVNDGLVSNTALMLGFAGALTEQSVVRLLGIAGLLAGAISMAFGEYISMRAQAELYEKELALERHELSVNQESEIEELAATYRSRGARPELAAEMARVIMSDTEMALEVHAKEELGIDPQNLGSPLKAALSSFIFFAIGALFPLLPWFWTSGAQAVWLSIIMAVTGAGIVGTLLGEYTTRSYTWCILRQMFIVAVGSVIVFGIGSAIGVTV